MINDKKPNLGKRLKVGETFRTTTKTMTKNRHGSTRWNKDLTGPLITYEVLKPKDKRHFTKGKRRYYCEVVAHIETKTGYFCTLVGNSLWKGNRWWQFTYLVKVLEN
jgi:hypothetical protein